MRTAKRKKPFAFLLDAKRFKRLRRKAKCEPNKETIAAIEAARAGRYAGTIDLSSREAFIRSCGG
jgi:hypothetical protein